MLIIYLYSSIFFLSIKKSSQIFSGPVRARVLTFCILLQRVELYFVKKKQKKKKKHDAVIYLTFLFNLFPFPICHSNVRHKEICVKDASGTIRPRIFKVCTNIGFDLLYCVRDSQYPHSYFSLLFIFSSLGLCPWRAYHVTQSLASASVGFRIRVSTMFVFKRCA